jgi:phosphoribosylanthranilate isomerase
MRPRVKICGIRRLEDALLAAELGADAVGFVFWPESPRFIDPYRARDIVRRLPPFMTTVGVFVDQPADFVNGVADLLALGAVQFHGHEAAADYARSSHRVIKAVAIGDSFDRARDLDAVPPHVTVLLDAHDPIKRGGTGKSIDWAVAADAARRRLVILSGGLQPSNVASALGAVHPYAVDVSSGVESSPGVKDPDKLRAFFAAIHPRPERGAEGSRG